MSQIFEMLKVASPVFVRVRALAELVVPGSWFPKDRLVGDKLTEGWPAAPAHLEMQSTASTAKSGWRTGQPPRRIFRPLIRRHPNRLLQTGIILLHWSATGASRQGSGEAVFRTIAENIGSLFGGQNSSGPKPNALVRRNGRYNRNGLNRGEAPARLYVLVLQQVSLVLLATPHALHSVKMSAIRLLWRNELVMSFYEIIPSPAVLDLLLFRIRPVASRLITCRAILRHTPQRMTTVPLGRNSKWVSRHKLDENVARGMIAPRVLQPSEGRESRPGLRSLAALHVKEL